MPKQAHLSCVHEGPCEDLIRLARLHQAVHLGLGACRGTEGNAVSSKASCCRPFGPPRALLVLASGGGEPVTAVMRRSMVSRYSRWICSLKWAHVDVAAVGSHFLAGGMGRPPGQQPLVRKPRSGRRPPVSPAQLSVNRKWSSHLPEVAEFPHDVPQLALELKGYVATHAHMGREEL